MKKSVIFLLFTILFFATNLYSFDGGDGSSGNPYQVATATDLNNVRNYLTSYFIQTANIDLTSYSTGFGWDPIGNNVNGERFLGSYNGDGYTISNLFIDRALEVEVGLFGCLGYDGLEVEIKNVGLLNVEVAGGRGTGSLVGRVKGNNDTRIEFCFARNGTVVGDGATGGLVGSNNSFKENAANAEGFKPVISKCYAHIDVSWSRKPGSGADKFGGLVGCNQKGITQFSYALGSVTVNNDPQVGSIVPERIGGLAGCTFLRGRITNSYSAGSVTTTGSVNVDRVGGLVGYVGLGNDAGTVNDSFWDTETSGQPTSAGGTGQTTSEMKTQSTFTNWDFTTTWEIVGGDGANYPRLHYNPDPTLPVELSTFTAQFIENTPTLYWSTQTETDNMGWFVYRNEENDFTTSEKISEFIEGYGTTTQQQSYLYEDRIQNPEVEDTYYYWLESIDFSGIVNHYDKVAVMQIPYIHNPDPHIAIPRKYGLKTDPNPFNSNLTVSYMLPQTDMVRVEIYNLYGQLLAEFNEGLRTAEKQHTIDWNGKDLYGQNVSSGVLLIKFITSEDFETTKAILLR